MCCQIVSCAHTVIPQFPEPRVSTPSVPPSNSPIPYNIPQSEKNTACFSSVESLNVNPGGGNATIQCPEESPRNGGQTISPHRSTGAETTFQHTDHQRESTTKTGFACVAPQIKSTAYMQEPGTHTRLHGCWNYLHCLTTFPADTGSLILIVAIYIPKIMAQKNTAILSPWYLETWVPDAHQSAVGN